MSTPVFLGFLGGSAGEESACNVGHRGLIPGLGGSPGEGKGYSLQYSGLENSLNCVVHGVAKSQTQLSHFHFLSFRIKILCLTPSPPNSYSFPFLSPSRSAKPFSKPIFRHPG